jgi:hypothetical protein
MKKWISLVLIVLLIFTLSGCKNKSTPYNYYIINYDAPDNYIFYDEERYIKQGFIYDYDDIAISLIESSELRSNMKPFVHNRYVVGNNLYFLFEHYQKPDASGEDASHDETLVKIDLATDDVTLLKTFNDIPGDNSMNIVGMLGDTYLIYRILSTITVVDLTRDEVYYEETLDLSLGEAYHYEAGILYLFKGTTLHKIDFNLQTQIDTEINVSYTNVEIKYPHILFYENTSLDHIYDVNTLEVVAKTDYESYVSQTTYAVFSLLDDNIVINDVVIHLEDTYETPIIKGLIERDQNHHLELYFHEYSKIDYNSFYIGVTHDKSAMLNYDRLYTMMFKYEMGVGFTYIGYYNQASDVSVVELSNTDS